MFPTDYIVYLQLLLFLFISPGLPRVLIVSHTLNYGLKRSVWTAFGDISANFLQGFAMVFLIGTFLKDNPEILNMLKWAGILFTVYLGYNKLFIDTTSRLITTRPEFYIALITMVLGTQFFIAGFIAEIILKFNLNKNAYSIKNKTF